MIKIIRLAKPQILQKRGSEWTQRLCDNLKNYYQAVQAYEEEKSQHRPPQPEASASHYAHQQIKRQLDRMFGNKCAFCESIVTAVSYQNVEHFRPKSIYPSLAYEWENLLFACTVCNSGYKKTQFPLLDNSQPALDENNPCALDASDTNALINPCEEDPQDFFSFDDEWIACLNKRAEITRDVCGLNREALLDERREWLGVIETTAKAVLLAKKIGANSAEEEFTTRLKRYVQPSKKYYAKLVFS